MWHRIGLIGDVHAEHQHLALALEFFASQGVDGVLCTGDLADGDGDLAQCVALLTEYDVHVVRGNHDRWLLQNKARHVPHAHHREDVCERTLNYLTDLPMQRHITTSAGRLLLCHGMADNDLQKIWPGTERMPPERSDCLDDLIARREFRFIVNGHVHYRTLIHFDELILINAGTLRRRHHPGFSILDLTASEIVGFELEPEVHEVKRLSLIPGENDQVFTNTQHFTGDWQPVTLYV